MTPRAWKTLVVGVLAIAGIGAFASTQGRSSSSTKPLAHWGLYFGKVGRGCNDFCAARLRPGFCSRRDWHTARERPTLCADWGTLKHRSYVLRGRTRNCARSHDMPHHKAAYRLLRARHLCRLFAGSAIHRQVPKHWPGTFGPAPGYAGWGALLGVGIATTIPYSAYLVLIAAELASGPAIGAVAGAAFGVTREAIAAVAAWRLSGPKEITDLLTRFAQPAARLNML
jgi:hypothetical protein